MDVVQRLIAAVWLGSAVFLMLAASAAFRVAPNATVAADVVGALLARWHYIALGAPFILFALELRSARRLILIVLFAAVVIAALQSLVDLRIRSIRRMSIAPISELHREDPVRRRFGMLHGVSMMLLVVQTIAAAAVVASKRKEVRLMSDDDTYNAIVNERGQYSIWPADRKNPLGWNDVGKSGSKGYVLDYLKEVWTDPRPLGGGIRRKTEGGESGGGP